MSSFISLLKLLRISQPPTFDQKHPVVTDDRFSDSLLQICLAHCNHFVLHNPFLYKFNGDQTFVKLSFHPFSFHILRQRNFPLKHLRTPLLFEVIKYHLGPLTVPKTTSDSFIERQIEIACR